MTAPLQTARCEDVAAHLSEFLDRELEPVAAADVARHLDRCPGCARLAGELARTIRALHGLAWRWCGGRTGRTS